MHFEDKEISHDEWKEMKWASRSQSGDKYTVRIWYDDRGGIDEDKTYSEQYLRSHNKGRFANSGGSGSDSSSSSKKSKGEKSGGGSSSSHSAPVEKEEYIPQPLTPEEEEVLETPIYDMDLAPAQWLQYIVELWNGVAKIRPELDEDIARVINKKKDMIHAVKTMVIPDDDTEFINLAVAFTTIKLSNSVVVFLKSDLDSSIDNGKFNKAIREKEEEVGKELQNEKWAHNEALRAQARVFISEGNYQHPFVKRYYIDEMEDAAKSGDISKLDIFDEVLCHYPAGFKEVDTCFRQVEVPTEEKKLEEFAKRMFEFAKRYCIVVISSEGNNIFQKTQSLVKSTQNMGTSSMLQISKSQSQMSASIAGSVQKGTQNLTSKLGQFSSLGGFNKASERIENARAERVQELNEGVIDIQGIFNDKFFEAVSAGETKYASNPVFKDLRSQYEELKGKSKKQKRTMIFVYIGIVVVLIVLALIFSN